MITSAIASPAAISSAVLLRRHRVSLPSGFSTALPSASRKFFPLTSTFDPIEKDTVPSSQAFKFHVKCRAALDPVITNVETKVDVETQTLTNTDALELKFEDVFVLNRVASSAPKTSRKEKNPKKLNSSAAQSNKTGYQPVIQYPLGTESAIKAMLEQNTLVFVVDEHADKNIIKDAFKNMFNVRAKKVNTAIMPDGTKKAYIMLASDFNAVDLAKKIKIL